MRLKNNVVFIRMMEKDKLYVYIYIFFTYFELLPHYLLLLQDSHLFSSFLRLIMAYLAEVVCNVHNETSGRTTALPRTGIGLYGGKYKRIFDNS